MVAINRRIDKDEISKNIKKDIVIIEDDIICNLFGKIQEKTIAIIKESITSVEYIVMVLSHLVYHLLSLKSN